jgi:hypothetical protein
MLFCASLPAMRLGRHYNFPGGVAPILRGMCLQRFGDGDLSGDRLPWSCFRNVSDMPQAPSHVEDDLRATPMQPRNL